MSDRKRRSITIMVLGPTAAARSILVLHISQNEEPVQVRCMILDAWGWCTETTQRDGTGREEGGGFRMGNTCIPVAESC